MSVTRRRALKAGAGSVAVALAGCLSDPTDDSSDGSGSTDTDSTGASGGSDGDLTGHAAFFTVWDWAKAVVGDTAAIESAVSAGEMGHGWEPPGDLALDVAESDFFIYLDTPEFSWAQNVAAQVEDEGVHVIDTMDGVAGSDLLAWDAEPAPESDTGYDWDPGSVAVGDVDVFHQESGNLVAFWHVDHWDGSLPDVQVDDSMAIDTVFYDADGRVVPLGEDELFQIDGVVPDGIPGGEAVSIESRGDHIEILGQEEGRTRIAVQLRAGEEVIWESEEGLDITITEEDPGEVEGIDEDEIDDAAFYDPHVWVDPVLAMDQVEYIAEAFTEIDPDNAEIYRENAAAYIERLESVDQQFREVVEKADTKTAVFAGHDAFQYIEQRYGFQLHSPQGISPDAEPSPDDIAGTLELVEDNNIDTILYDPFETPDHTAPPLAQRILEETDAENAEPLTPAEGTTEEWADNDWGWVEQMEEINIPSLRAALRAD